MSSHSLVLERKTWQGPRCFHLKFCCMILVHCLLAFRDARETSEAGVMFVPLQAIYFLWIVVNFLSSRSRNVTRSGCPFLFANFKGILSSVSNRSSCLLFRRLSAPFSWSSVSGAPGLAPSLWVSRFREAPSAPGLTSVILLGRQAGAHIPVSSPGRSRPPDRLGSTPATSAV